MATVAQLKKDFVNTLHSIKPGRESYGVFSDWLEIAAITLHQVPYQAGDFPKDETYERLEAKYMETIEGYSRDDLNLMAGMMGMTLTAHRIQFGDFLGEIAAENNFLNSNIGQIFTPHALCILAASVSMQNVDETLEKKGIITIGDPAAGSGNMLIASAEVLLEKGIDPRSAAQFMATDVSRNAFCMAYIQLCALDLQAMVTHGNTLSNEVWEQRPTPQLRYFDQWLKQHKVEHMLEQLIKDPDAFVRGAHDNDKQITPPAPLSADTEPDILLPEPQQLNLFMDGYDEKQ